MARRGAMVMGTVLTVTVVAGSESAAAAMADAALAEAARWDDVLTTWRPEGELARFVARSGRGPTPVSPSLAFALESMLDLARATSGAFDPAVRDGRGPSPGIAEVLALGSGPVVARDADSPAPMRTADLASGAGIDPGAIGKGLALDAVATLLKRRGAKAAFLDFGSSSQLGIGAPPGDPRGWKVAITDASGLRPVGIVRLKDRSLSTSRAGAEDTTPVLDPRSGEPAPAPRIATVLGPGAGEADAWSTAVVVLGPGGVDAAREHGLEVFYEDADGRRVSPGFPLEAATGGPGEDPDHDPS